MSTVDKAERAPREPKRRAGAAVAAGLAAILGLGVATADAAPIFDSSTTYIQDNGNGTYRWRTDLSNISTDPSEDNSGISAVLYTGDTDNHYFTGEVGGFWQLVDANALKFSAELWDGAGAIDPPGLDPTADMLSIFYDSPFNTLGNSKIEVQTDGSGVYTINDAQLPTVPEPATLALLLAGAGILGAGAARRRNR